MKSYFEKYEITIVGLLAILIGIIQYLSNRSLWLDEAYLSLNILNRDFFELLKPLDYIQVAPIGFLYLEKLTSILIPNSEYGLRLVPLFAFVVSVFFFLRTLKLLKFQFLTIFVFSCFFCFNPTLIYYSSEIKQYSTDLFVSIIFLYLCIKQYQSDSNNYRGLLLFSSFAVWFSLITVILFSAFILFQFILNYKSRAINKIYSLVGFMPWFLSFGVYFILFIFEHPSKEEQIATFKSYNVFVPTNLFSLEFVFFVFVKIRSTFGELLSFWYVGEFSLILLNLLGLWNLFFRTKEKLGFLLLLPIAIHLVLSYFKMYPFDSRLILYQIPYILIVCAYGFDFFLSRFGQLTLPKNSLILLAPLIILIFFAFNLYRTGYPIKHQEIRSCIEFINLHSKNEPVYVSYFAKQPFQFYQKINFTILDEFDSDSGYIEKYKSELERMPKRVGWYLFSNNASDQRRRKFFLDFCESNSSVVLKKSENVGAFVYLVDFK